MLDALILFCDSLNELTEYDLITISSSFYSQVLDAFNCQKCLAKNNIKLREMKDCFTPNYKSDRKLIQGRNKITYYKCVGNFRLVEWESIYQLYESWKTSGCNPFGQVFIDIPNKNLEIFYLIDSLVETEISKKMKRK